MGLLDFTNTDGGMQGLGLLAAAAPSMAPMNLAGRIAMAGQSYQGIKDAALKQQDLAQQIQMRNIGLQQAQQKWALQLPFLQSLANQMSGGQQSDAQAIPQDAQSEQPQSVGPNSAAAMFGATSMPTQQPKVITQQPSQGSNQGGSMFGVPRSVAIPTIALNGFDKFGELIGKYNEPTEFIKQMNAAGIEPGSPLGRQIIQQNIAKTNYIAPTRLGEGAYNDPVSGPQGLPTTAPAGYMNVRGADGTWSTVPVAGGLAAISDSKAAGLRGENTQTPTIAYDKNGTPVNTTKAAQVNAANGQTNNFGNLRPVGSNTGFQSFATPEAGLSAIDNNLKSYGDKGINTISGVISRWAPPNENDTKSYIADVSSRLGIKPDQKIDLKSPVVRQALSTAIMLHENGSNILTGANNSNTELLPAQPPGLVKNAEAAQTASAQTMKDSYSKLQSGSSTAQSALEAIKKMKELSANKWAIMAGPLGDKATSLSPEAAEYEKQRANLNTLLANQNGAGGTDAGRALVGDSIPSYGKPREAQQQGLSTLENQLRSQIVLKNNFLTPAYQSGDSKKYTEMESQYDQHITPSMVPLLTMPPGQSRALVLKNAAKDPVMKANLTWAVQNGLLK